MLSVDLVPLPVRVYLGNRAGHATGEGEAEVVDLANGTVLARLVGDPLPQLLVDKTSNW